MADPIDAEAALVIGRAERLAGRTIAEIAESLGRPLPESFERHKGFVGELIERALGLARRSGPGPDLPTLEVKTLPIGVLREPSESTFICVASSGALDVPWEESIVRKKVARVLFVPVDGAYVPGPRRRVGTAFVWELSPADDALLAMDWDNLSEHAAIHGESATSAHLGVALQIRPKGQNSEEQRPRRDEDGVLRSLQPRGFYLRRSITTALLSRANLV